MERIERLRRRTPAELATLLRARSDVLVGRAPRTLGELAQRLDSGPSVTTALRRLNAPRLQVVVATTALSGQPTVTRLADFLGADPRADLQALADLDLLWFDDVVHVDPAVRRQVPDLLELGPPFDELADIFPHQALQITVAALGLARTTSKRAAVEVLGAFFGDADRIRDHAAQFPRDLLIELQQLAVDSRTFDDGFVGGFGAYSRREQRAASASAALDTGLVIGSGGWGDPVFMPAEVTLALRGPGFRLQYDRDPPVVSRLPVSRVDADAAAALTRFDASATAVLDQVAAKPLPAVQSGGVGRRELQRLAKVTSSDVVTVMIVLELAADAGLVSPGRPVFVTDAFAGWRDDEPAARAVTLLRAWWAFAGCPGDQRDDDGNARRAFVRRPSEGSRSARHLMLTVLRTDTGLSGDDLGALAGWSAPGADAGDPPYEAHREEAELLGAVAQGALTAIGVALRDGDDAALLAAAAAALPASSTTAVFGSDLTVFVAGSPSARVSLLLDSCAARESGGGAVTWRLSAASVRRALDDGVALEQLRTSLREIAASGALPSAVEVLLDDVARVWGRARVRDAAGVVVSDDAALLAGLQHDRKLATLGLTQVAPTVLVATADGRTVLKLLRSAGYLPAWDGEDDDAPAVVVRRRMPPRAVPLTPPLDPAELARRLLDPATTAPEPGTTEQMVRRFAEHLTDDQAAVLAAAIDARERVHIVYESSTGGITERVVRPSDVAAGRLWAWCELRRDDREFVVARVLGVRAV